MFIARAHQLVMEGYQWTHNQVNTQALSAARAQESIFVIVVDVHRLMCVNDFNFSLFRSSIPARSTRRRRCYVVAIDVGNFSHLVCSPESGLYFCCRT